MTVANTFPVLAVDLTSLTTTQLAALRADNALTCGVFQHNLFFQNLVTSTNANNRKSTFVVAYDTLVEVVAVQAATMTAASTTTVTIVGDGAIANFPITVSGTTGTTLSKLSRLLFDGTKGKAGLDFATTSRVVRVWPKGSTITVTVDTTSVATPSTLQVCIAGREFYARE